GRPPAESAVAGPVRGREGRHPDPHAAFGDASRTFGIRVNALAPETILTEKNKQWISEPMQQQLIEAHPIRRLGTPEDVAQAALFLASEEASWITGVILDVTGGAVMV